MHRWFTNCSSFNLRDAAVGDRDWRDIAYYIDFVVAASVQGLQKHSGLSVKEKAKV
jgi:hypothetical protein